jgi:hypothetical protein
VIHGLRFDSRLTTFQHTLSFARHLKNCDVYYVNGLGLTSSPQLDQSFDLAIVTYELVAYRNTPFWNYISSRIGPLLSRALVRVVMPQDDYSSCAILDEFVVDQQMHFVFSPLTRDLHHLYPQSIAKGVAFFEALTGYWEASTTVPYLNFRRSFEARSTDLGQRVRHLPPQFGALAQKKGVLALEFARVAQQAGFRCDVSTRDQDVLVGPDWWRFLGDIKFTVGRLGGASIADPRGRLAFKVSQLQLRRPGISFEEIASYLWTDDLPQGDFSAVSPRIFECAAMGVCQILEMDHYFDQFKPWKHYIPLEQDLSNVSEVFEVMRDQGTCVAIAREAEDVLIHSGKYTYGEFVRFLMKATINFDLDEVSLPANAIDVDEDLFGVLDPKEVEQAKQSARKILAWAKNNSPSTINGIVTTWVRSFRNRALIVESMTIPWSPALRHLKST